jgi:hypothetical protein
MVRQKGIMKKQLRLKLEMTIMPNKKKGRLDN